MAAPEQLERDVRKVAHVAQAHRKEALRGAVEVRAQPDVLDPGDFDDVLDTDNDRSEERRVRKN